MDHERTGPENEVISLTAAAQLLAVDGVPPAPVTIWRWCRKGKRGVYLQAWRRGRQLVTTPQAVHEFDRAVAEADAESWARSQGESTTSQSDVEQRAAALGI